MKNSSQIKKVINQAYSEIANTSGCCCKCKSVANYAVQRQTKNVGYSRKEMTATPDGSNLGLGCGNPTAIASLKVGEVVLDLGCGAGFDVFLAANKVGKKGKVIGIDFSEEMIKKAKINAKNGDYKNVEFRQGDIESIPIKDESANVIISNCVINLAPNKDKVFKEAFRVLMKKGRLLVSDVVLIKALPKELKEDKNLLTGCIAGAIMKEKYLKLLKEIGFKNIIVQKETPSYLKNYAVSITVSAEKL